MCQAEQMSQQIIDACREDGMRITDKRIALIRHLCEYEQPEDSVSLWLSFRAKGHKVSIAFMYQVFGHLIKMGFVKPYFNPEIRRHMYQIQPR